MKSNLPFYLVGWIVMMKAADSAAFLLPYGFFRRLICWLHALTFELLAFCALALLRLLPPRVFKSKPKTQNGRPVLLVHGYLNAGFVWLYMKRKFEEKGVGPVYTINLGSPFGSIRRHALQVEHMARLIREESGSEQLTLIGHSMGGLVSTYYAANFAPKGSVQNVITIASPLQGTLVAKIGLGRCAREMERDSELIKELNDSIHSEKIKFHHIATRTDQLVIPFRSAFFPTSAHDSFIVENLGHASLLFSPRVAKQLCSWLEGNP